VEVGFWGSIGQDAQSSQGGPWMARRGDPQNSAGGREFLRSKNQQAGWPFFWLLFFGHTKKSNPPEARCLAFVLSPLKTPLFWVFNLNCF